MLSAFLNAPRSTAVGRVSLEFGGHGCRQAVLFVDTITEFVSRRKGQASIGAAGSSYGSACRRYQHAVRLGIVKRARNPECSLVITLRPTWRLRRLSLNFLEGIVESACGGRMTSD